MAVLQTDSKCSHTTVYAALLTRLALDAYINLFGLDM